MLWLRGSVVQVWCFSWEPDRTPPVCKKLLSRGSLVVEVLGRDWKCWSGVALSGLALAASVARGHEGGELRCFFCDAGVVLLVGKLVSKKAPVWSV